MTDTTTLQRRPGTLSLRTRPTGWVPPEGSYAFVLGSDEPGYFGRFKSLDNISVEVIGGWGSASHVRVRMRTRSQLADLPAGWVWKAYARIDSDVAWSFDLETGVTRDYYDLAINVQGYGPPANFSVTLIANGPSGSAVDELEIPAVYLDDWTFDTNEGLFLINRTPQPGDVGVPVDTAIRFDISDTDTDVDDTNTQVYVNGVLAFDGTAGGAQSGWGASIGHPLVGGVTQYSITRMGDFDSLEVVEVRVVSRNLSGSHVLDETYSFTIQDLTAPVVLAAVSRDHMTVRVSFDEAVDDEALDPANYAFTRREGPSVLVHAVSVARVSTAVVDVTLDVPITRALLYRVTVSGVSDVFGNEIEAPNDFADFRGFECDVPADRDFELWKMLSRASRDSDEDETLFRTCSVVQEVIDLLLCDVDAWTDILDVDSAAERYVDQMLIGLGNPFDFDLSVDDKRRLVRTLVQIYQRKGTALGIIDVIRFFLGLEVTLDEWNTSPGWILGESELGVDTILGPSDRRALYTFDVVSLVSLTDEQRAIIRELVDYMKPAHTHLGSIVEPTPPTVIDHLELGLSELGGDEWMLH